MICEECETVAHCLKNGCVPKHQALDRMAENVSEYDVGLYTTPPNVATPLAAQRQWVGLTPDDIRQLEKENTVGGLHGDYCPTWDLIESVEAKLKEKNSD